MIKITIHRFQDYMAKRKKVWTSTHFWLSLIVSVVGTVYIYKVFLGLGDLIKHRFGWTGLTILFLVWGIVNIIWEKNSDKILARVLSNNHIATSLNSSMFLKLSSFLFCNKIQVEVFEPIIADWQSEYFEALFKKEIWKARWINVRYTYAFIVAMWQKSPIGDLIEFVRKIAK